MHQETLLQGGGDCRNVRVRRQLLATASAVVLAATLACTAAKADGGDNPNDRFTFEFGGGLQFYGGGDMTWFETTAGAPFKIGGKSGWDITGKATFEPAHSPWIFSVAVQYGRSGRKNKSATGDFYNPNFESYGYFNAKADHREQHLVVDFEVGQDVGLGMFGMNGSSILSAGLRYAHFEATTNVAANFYFSSGDLYFIEGLKEKRTFSGVGPVISWDASAPFFNSDGPFSFDFGVAGAVLFGTHSARLDLSYSGVPFSSFKRSKTITVPSFDAYAAISYHCVDCGASASLGYRVDSFFNVFDGAGFGPSGSDTDRIFHGPYLSVKFDTGG